jgi:anti-sigma factor RsiW
MADLITRLFRPRPPGGLPCVQMVQLVTDYLEGALSGRDRRRFEAHLAGCEHCTRYVEQMRETLRLLGRIPPESLSGRAQDELLAAFRDWRREGEL